jgi:hypothetical protein
LKAVLILQQFRRTAARLAFFEAEQYRGEKIRDSGCLDPPRNLMIPYF